MKPVVIPSALLERLASARRVAALTGAGISAESGIATFRDPGGLWARFRPEELADVRAFLANPELVQGWYRYRRDLVTRARPNPGHLALVELEGLLPGFTLITQNVDDLHRRAGSKDVVELHGNLMRSYCIDCEASAPASGFEGDGPERCFACGGLVRPDVVWFGELLPESALTRAWEAASRADVFLSVGTSGVVHPAADLPRRAASAGARTVEVNVEPSVLAPGMDDVLVGPAGVVLPALVEALRAARTAAWPAS